jgi:lipopolysaccharide biosynthesis regulator YciM
MELDLAWLLVLPVVFGLGWFTARYDRGQQRRETKHVPKDILDGLSHVLSQDLEKATEALLSAARSAPDAPALHRAVGNLYRRRGLTDRAIEVHEVALRNPEVTGSDRLELMMDLGRDYLASGLFDRAQEVFKQVVVDSGSSQSGPGSVAGAGVTSTSVDKAASSATSGAEFANEARLALMNLSQRIRDWRAAICWAHELPQKNPQLLGHFHCELAEIALAKGDLDEAAKELDAASGFDAPGPERRVALLREMLKDAKGVPSGQSSSNDGQGSPGVGGAAASGPGAVLNAPPASMNACRVCGFRSRQNYWQCPGCHQWDSFDAVKS